MNVIHYCNLDESLLDEESLVCYNALECLYKTKELHYMSYIVLRMFENIEVGYFGPFPSIVYDLLLHVYNNLVFYH